MGYEMEILIQLPFITLLFFIYFALFQKMNFLGDSRKKSVKRGHVILASLVVLATVIFAPPELTYFFYAFFRNLSVIIMSFFIFAVLTIIFNFALVGEKDRKRKSIILALIVTAILIFSTNILQIFQLPPATGIYNLYIVWLILLLTFGLFFIVK